MDAEGLRKAYKYKLKPTPEQERQLEAVLWRCRTLYNTALEQRITVYRQRGVTLTCSQQQAELPDLKAAFPAYGAIHSQVLQDVLTRLDKTYQAFFRRLGWERRDRRAAASRASRGATATTPSPTSSTATARDARQRLSSVLLARLGASRVRWSRPLEGTPKTVTISSVRPMAGMPSSRAPRCPAAAAATHRTRDGH